MPVIPEIADRADRFEEIFRDLHSHPELGFQETRTSRLVAKYLREFGIDEVHENIGGTGVVGVLNGVTPGRTIALRADMDALPITEDSGLSYASRNGGVMHACGHDGHTTMLLAAAHHLADKRDFAGQAIFVFQPAEEGLGGAQAMIADGLFERFRIDEIYGLHNRPDGQPNKARVCKGRAMAGSSFFDIRVKGHGAHAAMPQVSRDPLVVAAALVGQLQTILGRNIAPTQSCVLSVTRIHSGSAYNLIPGAAELAGTLRFFDNSVRDLAQSRIREICAGFALAYGVEIEVDFREVFSVLCNDLQLSDEWLAAAADIVGVHNASDDLHPMMGSEDFAAMLEQVPGAFGMLSHAGNIPLHNAAFVLDPEILSVGASIYVRLVERRGSQTQD